MAAMFSSGSLHRGDLASCATCPPSTSGLQQRYPLRTCQQSPSSSRSRCWSASDSQVYRFKHHFKPEQSQQPSDTLLGWPLQENAAYSQRVAVAGEDSRINPAELWDGQEPPGSLKLSNPFAQHFRVSKVAVPVPVSLPGSEFWQVEALNDYSRDWPSLKYVDGKWEFRKGFLERVDDPKVVPFFFYRGLEQLCYSWGDRAFQALFTAAYAGVHLAIFSWFWSSNPSLAVAVGLNWGLGKLSLAKWGLLLVLASQERLWLYFAFLAAKLIDRGLAKLFPPVRQFCWAMFTVWALFVALSPVHYYPLPFAPFAPGTLGPQEALC